MNNLISRQSAIDVADYTDYTGLAIEDVKKVTDEVVKGLKQLPSIDAVSVVRCENCKCKDKYENFCRRFLREIDPSDYCSYAEGKEE